MVGQEIRIRLGWKDDRFFVSELKDALPGNCTVEDGEIVVRLHGETMDVLIAQQKLRAIVYGYKIDRNLIKTVTV